MLWFCTLLSLRCFGSTFLYMTVFFSSFLSLFWCRNLFLVQIILFSQPDYISVYRILFCLKILRCLCVETSWFVTITFPVSAYIGSLCARTSMLADPQQQYIVFLKQFLKGGFYTGKNRTPPAAEITRSSKRRFLHPRKGNFCFALPPAPMHTTLIHAPAFSIAWARRGFYTGKISYSALHLCLHGNALPLSPKRDFHSAQFVTATGSIQKKLWKRRLFHGKKEVSTCLFWLIGL